MSKEDVNWREAFRSKMTSGITEDSEFYEITSLRIPEVISVVAGKKGFYFRTKTGVFLLDTRGRLTTIYSKKYPGWLTKSIRGEVLLDRLDGKFDNLDLGREEVVKKFDLGFSRHKKTWDPSQSFRLDEELYNVGILGRYRSRENPSYIFKRKNDNKINYELYSEEGILTRTIPANDYGMIYCFQDKIYNSWDPVGNRWSYEDDFSGMHWFPGEKSSWGQIAIHNLITEKLLHLYPEVLPAKPVTSINSRSNYRWGEKYLTTIDGLLYILLDTNEWFRLISHR